MIKYLPLFLLLTVTLTHTSQAATQKKYFTLLNPSKARLLLGNYPARGSIEEERDFDILLRYQESRTEQDCALAAKQVNTSLKSLFVNGDGPLTSKEAKRFSFAVLKAYIEAGINTHIAKKTFKRPRPYIRNPLIKPCIKREKSYAYPSGHTTVSRVMAHVLSYKYPDRAEAFMRRADEVAENRVLGGVHHPSDIEAGKKLGDVIARKVLKSEKFLKQLQAI